MVLLVIVLATIAAFVFFAISEICQKKGRYNFGVLNFGIFVVFGLVALFGFIGGLIMAFDVLPQDIMLDNRISVLEEENEIIEQNISKIIEEYQKHEQGVSNDQITEENPIILIALFPEIESSDYVQQQLEIYNSNTQKIKNLKYQKIEIAKQKWLLYFGK